MNYKHYSLLLLAGITCITTALAQPRIKGQGVLGGNEDDVLTSMYLTKDGGLLAGGYSYSNISGNKTENSKGVPDYWVVKLDINRSIQWDKTIGGNSFEHLNSLQQTTDGGCIVGGYSRSDKSGDKTQNSIGEEDYWIVKLDADGNIQWDKTIGGSRSDILYALQQTTDGGYILGGHSSSNISGDKTENSRGGDDYWIVKLDGSGNIQWDKTIGGNDADYLQVLQQTTDGGYILGGSSYSNISGEKTENNRGAETSLDYWVVKLDANGNIQWDKTIGGSSSDLLGDLRQTTDEGYIVGGYSRSNKSGDKSQNSKGPSFTYDYWIVKLDAAHTIRWDKTIGSVGDDALNSIRQTADGGYILGGYSGALISGDKTENPRGGEDYWVVKTNNLGKVQWDKTIGGTDNDGGVDIPVIVREIKRNDYVVGGSSYSGISGDKTGGNRGKAGRTSDYWIVELKYRKQDSTAITTVQGIRKSKEPVTNSLLAYPNPANDKLNIQSSGTATVTLTNAAGKVVVRQMINSRGVMRVAALPAGVYYLKNTTTGVTHKVMITH